MTSLVFVSAPFLSASWDLGTLSLRFWGKRILKRGFAGGDPGLPRGCSSCCHSLSDSCPIFGLCLTGLLPCRLSQTPACLHSCTAVSKAPHGEPPGPIAMILARSPGKPSTPLHSCFLSQGSPEKQSAKTQKRQCIICREG